MCCASHHSCVGLVIRSSVTMESTTIVHSWCRHCPCRPLQFPRLQFHPRLRSSQPAAATLQQTRGAAAAAGDLASTGNCSSGCSLPCSRACGAAEVRQVQRGCCLRCCWCRFTSCRSSTGCSLPCSRTCAAAGIRQIQQRRRWRRRRRRLHGRRACCSCRHRRGRW